MFCWLEWQAIPSHLSWKTCAHNCQYFYDPFNKKKETIIKVALSWESCLPMFCSLIEIPKRKKEKKYHALVLCLSIVFCGTKITKKGEGKMGMCVLCKTPKHYTWDLGLHPWLTLCNALLLRHCMTQRFFIYTF
jgi:hypothetical protein